jgi:hypothetical protein
MDRQHPECDTCNSEHAQIDFCMECQLLWTAELDTRAEIMDFVNSCGFLQQDQSHLFPHVGYEESELTISQPILQPMYIDLTVE